MTTTTGPGAKPGLIISQHRRSMILGYAANLIHPDHRHPNAVTGTAAPLLRWAAEAADEGDLRARMSAMSHASGNAPCPRMDRHREEHPPRPTPAEFIMQAILYYHFLTGLHVPATD